jgi:hypothetical protein
MRHQAAMKSAFFSKAKICPGNTQAASENLNDFRSLYLCILPPASGFLPLFYSEKIHFIRIPPKISSGQPDELPDQSEGYSGLMISSEVR